MDQVLIVEHDPKLGRLWARHIERSGAVVAVVGTQRAAVEALRVASYGALVIDLSLPGNGALAVADFASYRHPDVRVIFVTHDSFFSDGSIFALSSNARAFVQSDVPPEDLAAIVAYHAAAR